LSQLISITAKLQPVHKKLRTAGGYAVAYTYDASREGLGTLLVIAEITSPSKQAEEVSDLIIQTVGEHYYNSQDAKVTDPYSNLEVALRAVNQTLHDYTNAGHGNWVGKLSAIIGVMQNGELHFSHTGSARMLLFRGQKSREITQSNARDLVAVPLKTFAQIASGSLGDNDKVLLATPALFHLLSIPQLRQVIQDNTPQQAAEKIKGLIVRSSDNDRVSGIIVEIIRPEVAAVGDLGNPDSDTYIEPKAKLGATASAHAKPILHKGLTLARHGARVSKGFAMNQIWPRLRWALMQIIGGLRKALRNKMAARLVIVGTIIAIVLTGWLVQRHFESSTLSRLETRYNKLVTQTNEATQLSASGKKSDARAKLVTVQDGLKAIAADPQAQKMEADLAKKAKTDSEIVLPGALATSVTALLDQIDNLVHVNASAVHNLAALSNTKPRFMQNIGNKLALFNDTNGLSVSTLDLSNVTLKNGATATDSGKIISTTPSSAGDGVFILTDKPAVWFWRDSDGSLLEQTISFGTWPKGLSIASYNANLYLLAEDGKQIFKYSRTLSGFSGATAYFDKDTSTVAVASGLAVDGNVYTLGAKNLRRYLSGALKLSSDSIPSTLTQPRQLMTYPAANLVLSVDAKSGRLASFTSTDDSLSLFHQYDITGAGAIQSATYDTRTKQIYALTETSGVVRFTLN
jgi:hypothetical protein